MKEFLDVVDENDKVIGRASRDKCHTKGLLHRAVHVLILSSENEILLQKRSTKKDLYPGFWNSSVAGHVDAGETCEEAAKRETKEELGINVEAEEIFKVRKTYKGNGKIDNELITAYMARSDGPFDMDKNEVEFVRFFSFNEILKMMKSEKFTPGTVVIFNKLLTQKKLLKRLGLS